MGNNNYSTKEEMRMKLRHMRQMPVYLKNSAEVVGKVIKAVIGDDFQLSYIVIEREGNPPGMILSQDLYLGEEMLWIRDTNCIKSYLHGEELSIYEKKLGDMVVDNKGRELGNISDFILSPQEKKVSGVEVCSGAIGDLLHGRKELELEQIYWTSNESAMVDSEGRESRW
jgi:sporulation protein YlmC with PRC-barrel domain